MNTPDEPRTLADLKSGEAGTIQRFTDSLMSLKLLEMGLLPGAKVVMNRAAPLGCPVVFSVDGYQLSLRREEAGTVVID